MDDKELAFTPAHRQARMVKEKEVSPVELVEVYLRRIEELDSQLNSYLTVCADEALAAAREAQEAVTRGDDLGPLHGVPVAVKDLEMTTGIRTTFGSLIFRDYVPVSDSGVAERVKASGAIILGKTNTPEFGQSPTTENRLGDACRNPWDTACTAGGSSGGAAAALAAGLCPLATGSDAGGSIRIPASFCGVFGIKPTLGRVPRFGGVARPAPNPVSCPGPMARTVRDAALLLQALAGPDDRDVITIRQTPPDYMATLEGGVRGLRIAWSLDLGYAVVDPEVAQVTQRAAQVFQELGAAVEEVDLKVEDPRPVLRPMVYANLYAAYGHYYEERPQDLTDYVKARLEVGRRLTGMEYARAMRFLEQLKHRFAVLMEAYDLLLTPTMAVPAFPVGRRPSEIAGRPVDPDFGFSPFTFTFNATGQPAASVPCGLSAQGLPIGLHIVGRWGDEATVLRAAAVFEEARPWAGDLPPVS